ncbi:cilia- and flagella-associated protein 45-like [Xiphophorus maculatus]|uniref:cilia- and flagella-associated protein 45-like n=1 Tax=Xiphophorus maculatus TaxID=8083 RepID=UPI0006D90B64|nr:cilia- and flagella-associated protein 45-like [Xiphophorus maculatus]XP_027900718.1 cilia- and flagella-associated protein 45-like [Xiphophorus couchianus]
MKPASTSRTSGRYRKLADTSSADDDLFDKPNNSESMGEPTKTKKEQRILQIISKDLIRTLRVPRIERIEDTIALPSSGIRGIISKSRIGISEEREALKEAYNKEKEAKMKAAEERKNQILEIDQSQKENPELTEMQQDAQKRSKRIVSRAYDLQMEEEQEIKSLNKLILCAKAQATWDEQLVEKKEIKDLMDEEERRLDIMMEVERRRGLADMKMIEDLHKKQRMEGKDQIYGQIKERMEEKLNDNMLKELEKEQVHRDQERMNREYLEAMENKRKEQQLLQEEIMRINADVTRAKEKRLEEEKLATTRAMDYLKQKMEREEEFEAEQERIKREKEKEITRLRALQQRAKDYKAEQDAIRAKRSQDISDRKWRMQQKQLAEKKARDEANLKASRLAQVKNKEYCMMLEANREKADMERVLKDQLAQIAKEKEVEQKYNEEAQRHAASLRQQVKEQELLAAEKRREKFKEAERMFEEDRQRNMRLLEVKQRKLQELKATGIPEKYCIQVERKSRKIITDPRTVKA